MTLKDQNCHKVIKINHASCNSPRPPLADIVLFGLSLSSLPSRFLKCICLGGGGVSHTYKGCFVLLPNRCGISQSTPLRGPTSSRALVPFSNRCGTLQSSPEICNSPRPLLRDIVLFGLSLSGFSSRFLKCVY